MNYESFDWSLLDWGKDGSWGYKTDLFLDEHNKCDKLIVSKAFVDAYNKNDVSIIEPYISNPVYYSSESEEKGPLDKRSFLEIVSSEINNLHSSGVFTATIIPTSIENKYFDADVLVKIKIPFEGTKVIKLYLHTFLNTIYKISEVY